MKEWNRSSGRSSSKKAVGVNFESIVFCSIGMMFPTFGDIHLAPFSDEQLYLEHHSRANFW